MRRIAAAALLAAIFAGCAGTQKRGEEVVWPSPPNKPRLRYVRSITGTEGFDDRLAARIGRAILGTENENVIFNPNSVALSVDEKRLFVTNTIGYVLRFDLAEHSVSRVADDGGRKPLRPYGLAVDANDNLYVTDQAGLVFVYSPSDKFLRAFGQGAVQRPTGIAIDRKRQLVYVVDGGSQATQRHRVEVFALDGRHLRTIGTRGVKPNEFLFPSYAAVAPDGILYVADTMNGRVQSFDPDGNLVSVLGTLGDAPGEFGKPKGIAFDGAGNMHVVDGQLAQVQMFNSRSQLLMMYGGQSAHPGFMLLPNGIAITSKNHIFVADYAGNRVNEYVLFDTSEPAEEPKAAASAPAGSSQPAAEKPASPPEPPPPPGEDERARQSGP
jgi:sugar lactone lactonase YvrE